MKDFKTELDKLIAEGMREFKHIAQEMLVFQYDDNIHEKAVWTALRLHQAYESLAPLHSQIISKYPEFNHLFVLLSSVGFAHKCLIRAEQELEESVCSLAAEIKRSMDNE